QEPRQFGAFLNHYRKSPQPTECVVGLRGLELHARHAVHSNRSLCSQTSRGLPGGLGGLELRAGAFSRQISRCRLLGATCPHRYKSTVSEVITGNEAERHRNKDLRQQLNVLRRQVSKRPQLSNTDRFLFVWLYRWFPSVLSAIAILRPETIIRWHRAGFQSYWRERSRKPVGRPRISAELRNLIDGNV